MKLTLPFLIITLWLTLKTAETFSQTDFNFEHISTGQGLSQRAVWSMCQDREGFMWFGTLDGLYKYDGYRFTVIKPDPRDPTHTLRHNIISAIHEDRKGRLWVTTYGGGLHEVDKRTGKVTAYPISSISKIAWNVLTTIHEDPDGMLWMGGGNGLARLNPDTKQYKLFLANYVGGVIGDPSGRLWFNMAGKLNRFDRVTGKYRSFSLPSKKSTTSYIDAKGVLWILDFGQK